MKERHNKELFDILPANDQVDVSFWTPYSSIWQGFFKWNNNMKFHNVLVSSYSLPHPVCVLSVCFSPNVDVLLDSTQSCFQLSFDTRIWTLYIKFYSSIQCPFCQLKLIFTLSLKRCHIFNFLTPLWSLLLSRRSNRLLYCRKKTRKGTMICDETQRAKVYKGLKNSFSSKHLVPKACMKYKIDIFLMKCSLHVKYSKVIN